MRLALAVVVASCGGGTSRPPPPAAPAPCNDLAPCAEACDAAAPGACFRMTLLAAMADVDTAPRDLRDRVITLSRTACEGGDARVCAFLGGLYCGEAGCEEHWIDSLDDGCQAGVGTACAFLADLHEADPERAAPYRARAAERLGVECESGDAMSCFRLAELDPDPARVDDANRRAAAAFERQCRARDAIACAALADLVESGRGVPPSAARAETLTARACDLGLSSACPVRAEPAP